MASSSLVVSLTMILSYRYKAMEACQKKGKTKAVGVSNFSQAEMERLVKSVDAVSIHEPTLCPILSS